MGCLRTLLKVVSVLLVFWSQVVFASPLTVAVSIAPQEFLVKGIGGDLVKVVVVVPPGAEPHSYEPSPRQMELISRARLYLTIGVEMERVWIDRFEEMNPSMVVWPMDRRVERLVLPSGGYDPHTWLSTNNIRVMAFNTFKALGEVDPAHQDEFEKGYQRVLRRIGMVEERLGAMLEGCRGKAFVAMHPAWGYFAHQFGMEQLAVEREGRRPTTSELLSLVERAKRLGVKVVLVEPQFSSRPARVVAREIGAQVVVADPLDPRWDRVMLRLGEIMEGTCK